MEQERERPAVEKGQVLTCPDCHMAVALVKRDLFRGEAIMAQMFEPLNGTQITNASMAICPKPDCGGVWVSMLDGRVHAPRGWLP